MTATLRPFTKADTDWLVALHATIYGAEEGFDETFPVLVRQILDTFVQDAEARPPPRQAGWVAEDATGDGGQRLGSIFCVEESPDVAKLRLFVLEPRARGTGLAQAMMDTCLAFARGAGFRRMRLWTHESHLAACRLYQRNGFRCVESQKARSFGQDVVTQIWERDL
jgi:GNAT superfamily N-acetyltransferase